MRSQSVRPGWLAAALLLSSLGFLAQPVCAYERHDRAVLSAFREIVVEPSRSTVQVFSDGYVSALGTIIRSDGYIVTKASELKGKLEVLLPSGGKKLEAHEVTRDSATDLAVLKIDAAGLPMVRWSAQTSLPIGSWVATPGLTSNPVAIGVLSVAARQILPPQAALGIFLETTDDAARISAVEEGMAADRAGLKPGDVIRKVNGKEIRGASQLRQTIFSHQPGDKVTLIIERQGQEITVYATLGSKAQLEHGERADFQNSLGGPLSDRRAGFPLAIQHDSVLKPSDCGGPLVDLDGKAIGINIARAGRVESYALPASLVKETIDRLLQPQLTSAPAAAPHTGESSVAPAALPKTSGRER